MDDTIWRQDAINEVSESLKNTFVEHYEVAEKMINKVPPAPQVYDEEWRKKHYKQEFLDGYKCAKEQLKWVSVKDRLPEPETKTYWVCMDTGYQCQCRWTNVNPIWTELTTDWHWNLFDIPQYTKVVAWRSLPEPYREDEHDDTE